MTPRETAFMCAGICIGAATASAHAWLIGPHQAPVSGTIIFTAFTVAWLLLARTATPR